MIAGGGLAGLAAGCGLAGRGLRVELHEAGGYPRHRVCGEFVCGVEKGVLERLGIGACFEGGVFLQDMAWFHRGRRVWSGVLPRRAVGISRFLLDARLAGHFENLGGSLRTGSRLEDRERENLLWCAGRPKSGGPWVGLKAHFEALVPVADLEMHLGSSGYVGLSRIEGGRVNVCGLFSARAVRGRGAGSALAAVCRSCGLEGLADRLDSATLVAGSAHAVAGFRMGWRGPLNAGACGARIGDAVAMIPPFTGNGMSMAFESAMDAVEILGTPGLGRGEACAGLRRRLRRRFASRVRLACSLHPFLLHGVGQLLLCMAAQSRLLPVSRLFQALR